MEWQLKSFHELSTDELYEIIRLRVNVFVVEQNCPYEEVDGADKVAKHIFIKEQDGSIKAYSRLFEAGAYGKEASIGRVIVAKPYRRDGFGRELLNHAIAYLEKDCLQESIVIQAQTYLLSFYQSFGFEPFSDPYLHDGILHTDMRKMNKLS
ncbi:GNAT family N-acetyltransferase [Alkalihalobacillus pseudalcaliphilus]|uniref:GNAT family N-acetyltransferase n=1 Tax=Alkalihalobacillus pseudalcaliphilus TaxID=79884 RepID=UPI00064DB2ED|nr:GNAT family N-acetyltransferase [Alkalihalobacillus pseudalcaliphilus]KMK74728.1 GNAT family acetyltransferase [Alkalihalobacillus pseudalcaliphilus]